MQAYLLLEFPCVVIVGTGWQRLSLAACTALENSGRGFPGVFQGGRRQRLLQGLGLESGSRQLALRSEILSGMGEFSEPEIQGKAGREALAVALRDSINLKLVDLEDFGGIQEVHFTSFVLQ